MRMPTKPNAKNPCYDCGSTIPGHHTPHCEMAPPGSIKDLPMVPGTQWWTESPNLKREKETLAPQ